jgi:hypothetical protein
VIVFLIVIASIIAYLGIGFGVARITRRRLISIYTYHKGEIYYNRWNEKRERRNDGIDREQVGNWTWMLIFGWPVASWVFAIGQGLERDLDEADPHLQQQRIKQQNARIAELEHELKIK